MIIDESDVLKAIGLLENQGGTYTATDLANLLMIDRSKLYHKFGHLVRKNNSFPSEDDVAQILWKLKGYNEKNRVGQDEIAKELGVSRQTFANRYPKIKSLCPPGARFPKHVTGSVNVQDARIADLETEIARLKSSSEKEKVEYEKSVLSSIMRSDREIFNVKTLNRRADVEHKKLLILEQENRDVYMENISLKSDLSRYKNEASVGGCEIVKTIGPDYCSLDQNETNKKAILKELLALEKANLKNIEKLVTRIQPDWIILVQSYYLDVKNLLELLPVTGSVIVAESNYFGRNEFSRYFRDLKAKLLGVVVETSDARSKLSIRTRRLGVVESVFEQVNSGRLTYRVSDGFDGVLFIGDPNNV